MIGIRKLRFEHQEEVARWWKHHGVEEFRFQDLTGSTYLGSIDGRNVACVSLDGPVYGVAWLEAFVSNPFSTAKERADVTQQLLRQCKLEAKAKGAKKLFCMSPNTKLTTKYEGLGFKKTASVDAMIMELK